MLSLVKTWKELKKNGVMGINQRNADYILQYNKRHLYPLVDNKIITKQLAIDSGIAVPELYGIIRTEHEVSLVAKLLENHRDFVIKPAQGSGGDGIIVISDRYDSHRFKTMSGRLISLSEIEHQLSNIITGLYSLGGMRDSAIIEYRVKPDAIFKNISFEGVPDIRIIVLMGYPIMAMLRLPTRESNGKANLHQGAIGAGINLVTGKTLNGTWFNEKIERHPDTDNYLNGVTLPNWHKFMDLAASCYELVGLGYIGVDLVLDQEKGPMILELNARPGLNIQIANDIGLYKQTSQVEKHLAQLKAEGKTESVAERLVFIRSLVF